MMDRLKDEVAVVTGGAQGIGAAYALALAKAGAKVAIGDVADTGAVQAALQAVEGTTFCSRLDVTDPESVNEFVRLAEEKLGKISILVNNAALFSSLETVPFTEISSEDWDKVMTVNVRGSFEVAKAVVPSMRSNSRGSIINIASGTVFKGMPNFLHYVSSKGAIVALTRSLARELGADGIRVNCLAPGLVMSEGVVSKGVWAGEKLKANLSSRAIQRESEPDDIIGALIFLASNESAFVTGQTLVIDGGSVMH